MILSGSSAKGTAIHGSSDIDFLISLHNSIRNSRLTTLADVYESLYEEFKRHQFTNIRRQRVSIGISYRGFDLDFVPAIKDLGNTNYHKLYVNRPDKKYVQTNIKRNIDYVINSRRAKEIKLIKIWRKCNQLDFPSIYLEMFVIEALKYRPYERLSGNVMHVLSQLSEKLQTLRIEDISNSNNIISDLLRLDDKQAIIYKARQSLEGFNKTFSWRGVIY